MNHIVVGVLFFFSCSIPSFSVMMKIIIKRNIIGSSIVNGNILQYYFIILSLLGSCTFLLFQKPQLK